MEKYNKISSKMCKQIVQQIVHQKVQQKVQLKVQQKVQNNYVDKAICVYQVSGILILIALIRN